MSHEKRPRIPRGLKGDGAPLWSYGFRPFFLLAGVFAPVAMILWLGALVSGWEVGLNHVYVTRDNVEMGLDPGLIGAV